MRVVVAVAALFFAAACAEAPQTYRDLDRLGTDYQHMPRDADEATERDTCGARRFAQLVGTPAASIDRAALPASTRIITPDMMVTQDFSPQRLNIMVGTNGVVGSLRCF